MRNNGSFELRRRSPARSAGTETNPRMDAWEKQQVFRDMVVAVMRDGRMSQRRRRQLVRYAACLDINAVQAGRLVQQARHVFENERIAAAVPPVPVSPSHESADRGPVMRSRWVVPTITGLLWMATVAWVVW